MLALDAYAGPAATLVYNTATALAGSASGGTGPYTYAWSTVSAPSHGVVTLSNASSATSNCTLTGPNGSYVLRLTVTDAVLATATDDVTLTLSATLAQVAGTPLLNWDANSLSDGTVSSWASTGSDVTAATQSTAANKPTRSATSFNTSYPGVTFDGNDILKAILSTPIAIGTRVFAFFVAQYTDVSGGQSTIGIITSNDDGTAVLELYKTAGGNVTLYREDSSGGGTTTGAAANTSPHVFQVGFTASGTGALVIDNTASNSTQTGTPTASINHFRIGAEDDSGGAGFKGVVAQVLVYSAALTAADKYAIDALMRVAWGL